MRKRNLKKQSQYSKGQNDVKSVFTMVYGDLGGPEQRKNKAKQTQTQAERGLFAYGARDCHGPSGLAMTLVSLLFRVLVALQLRGKFEKTKPICG